MRRFAVRFTMTEKKQPPTTEGAETVNPTMTSPSTPNLVTSLMAERMAEAAELRRAAAVPLSEAESPHRFRRFLSAAVRQGSRQAQPAPIVQGR